MIYSGALPEPQEEIYKCTSCVERHGSFEPQPGIKPEHSCGHLTHNAELCGGPSGPSGLNDLLGVMRPRRLKWTTQA